MMLRHFHFDICNVMQTCWKASLSQITFKSDSINSASRLCKGVTRMSAAGSAAQFLQTVPYEAPSWSSKLSLVPTERVHLGILPTPIHKFNVPDLPGGVELWIKRDDLSGNQLSGNKVRKLEFIMAEVMARGHDCVITIGGIQSNHCRATATAARYLGIDCHLILRTSHALADADPGLTGNLLVERLAGAHIHQVTKEEYQQVGSKALGQQLEAELRAQGLNPYMVAVGGSTPLGTWGYLHATQEILDQTAGQGFTDVALACGSGSTTAGLALGFHLADSGVRLHSYGVCDSPDVFYDGIQQLFDGLGADADTVGASSRDMLSAVQAKGLGYAMSTEEELRTTMDVAASTGLVMDPVYSGKALYRMLCDMRDDRERWRGRKVLFLHTGGLLGLYDKVGQLQPLMEAQGKAERMLVSSACTPCAHLHPA